MNTMHHHDQRQTFETESLQADVMRFMAIIAFCLIAIMMLVKELPETTTSPDSITEVSVPASVEPVIPVSLPETLPVEPAPETQPEIPKPLPETSNTAEDRPLTLQFASDKAFMRLLTNDRIQLYAQKTAQKDVENEGAIKGDFYQMTPSFEVVPAEIHGELYEVMGSSLPGGVLQLFDQADLFLIRLPHATRAELMDLHQAHQTGGGRLLITGEGGVIYEERKS